MPERVPPADLSKVRTYPLAERKNKVSVREFARAVDPDRPLSSFLEGLPDVLGARALRGLASAIVEARSKDRPVLWGMGGHVVKVGLAPVLAQMMEEGIVTGVVLNGAAAIHDWEIAAVGATSEDVAEGLHAGRFGMAEETGRELAEAAKEAASRHEGLGEALGRRIVAQALPHRDASVLARAHLLGIPATVHVAIGSDIVHQHPEADGASIGEATFTDFRRLVTMVAGLAGGVYVNCGSAVQLPEVFLKALSLAQNLGHEVGDFATANLDMIRQYRTDENVLRRPTQGRGRAFAITGHHEINVPLLVAMILHERSRGSRARG